MRWWNTHTHTHIHTHRHPFNGPLSGTTQVSRYQKGKTNLDFTEARDSGWQWHQLGHMQVCTSLQTDNHASTPLVSFFTGRMPFLPPNQQHQSTEGRKETDGNMRKFGTKLCETNYPISFHVESGKVIHLQRLPEPGN